MAITQSRFKRNKLTKKLSKMSKEVTLACAIRGTATRNIAVLSQVTEQMNMAQDLLKTHKDEVFKYAKEIERAKLDIAISTQELEIKIERISATMLRLQEILRQSNVRLLLQTAQLDDEGSDV